MFVWRYTTAAAIGLAMVGSASAHITAQPNEAVAGSYFQTSFYVPHGCSGAPTHRHTCANPSGRQQIGPHLVMIGENSRPRVQTSGLRGFSTVFKLLI